MPLIKPVSLKEICENYAKSMDKKSILQTLPVQRKSVFVNNPLVMDAKATLAKVEITNQIDEKTYKTLENQMINEINEFLSKENEPIIQKINPITQDNFADIKSLMTDVIEYLPTEIKDKLSNCNDTLEYFKLIRNNSKLFGYGKQPEFQELEKKIKQYGIAAEDEVNFVKLNNDICNNYKEFVNIFTSKSTNPNVIKIEKELEKLGIRRVNFSDDLDMAKLVQEGVKSLIKRKIELPSSITVTAILPPRVGGENICELFDGKRHNHIYLNPFKVYSFKKSAESLKNIAEQTKSFQNTSNFYQEKMLNQIDYIVHNQHSSRNPNHSFYHEIGHSFQSKSLANCNNVDAEDLKLAKQISMYAATPNGREIVPEMFAKLMDGQTLTDKQMVLYLKLGGIVPHFS